MRLTLRTLLAYLDDTLEPAEAKLIGQKVAESDTARELIARIREVTRRRRITTPAASANDKAGPTENEIAEYLDNELTPERLAEVEQLALASDVHLAEIAACHQILTVVLGEPAVVPPTAYRRMYGLRKSPESNPQHSPPVRREKEEGLPEGKEVDETLRLGLPALHRASWANGMILAGGAVCVLVLLAVAIWMVLPASMFERDVDHRAEAPTTGTSRPLISAPAKKDTSSTKITSDTAAKKDNTVKDTTPKPEDPVLPKDKTPPVKPKHPEDEGPTPPNKGMRDVGQFEPIKDVPAVLLQKKTPDAKLWTRLMRTNDPATSRVITNTPLLSLPGYRSIVKLDSGAQLILWGNVPEICPIPEAYESLVTLHPSDEFDLDLTLTKGRIVVVNNKDQPFKMRLRFANPGKPEKNEIWDITLLERGTEVLINLWGSLPPGKQFYPKKDDIRRIPPNEFVLLLVMSGSIDFKLDLQPPFKMEPPPKDPLLQWDSQTGRLKPFPSTSVPFWAQALPPNTKEFPIDVKTRQEVLDALDSLARELSGPNLETGFVAAMKSNNTHQRRLVVRARGAMGDLPSVIQALSDKEPQARHAAIETMRAYISSGRENDYELFEELKQVLDPASAETAITLLHRPVPDENFQDVLVKYLTHNKVEIRELAHDLLLLLFPAGKEIGYNATAPLAQVQAAAAQWDALVKKSRGK
ncbi:MAG TPA: hypothetical protein VE988_20690 [Gemmataceae bacterium]|nr:hypothetical protein [Gemmataceae bacterium]